MPEEPTPPVADEAERQIKELVAIDIFDDDAPAALGDHGIRTRVGRRKIALVGFKDAPGRRFG